MWCQQCRQDVPAMIAGEAQILRCPRCESVLRPAAIEPAATNADNQAVPVAQSLPAGSPNVAAKETAPTARPWYDSWELDEQLRHIQRVLNAQPANHVSNRTDDSAAADQNSPQMRLDSPHAQLSGWHLAELPSVSLAQRVKRRGRGPGWVSGFFLPLGTMCFACGSALLGWSIVGGRPELWSIGLVMAAVGQIGLLVAFIAQLDRLWLEHRRSAERLCNVDKQLNELRTRAEMLGSPQEPNDQTFHAHFAHSASPQMLLADLKGQLDLLAMQIAQNDRSA